MLNSNPNLEKPIAPHEGVAVAAHMDRGASRFVAYVARSSRGFLIDARAGSAEFSPSADEALLFPTRQSAFAFLAIGCPALCRQIAIVSVPLEHPLAGRAVPAWRRPVRLGPRPSRAA